MGARHNMVAKARLKSGIGVLASSAQVAVKRALALRAHERMVRCRVNRLFVRNRRFVRRRAGGAAVASARGGNALAARRRPTT